ncbi:DUF2299 domain-containing protein [Archaeoglobus veneficus]|uniref:DUF2299 domain-containing protein n=1 Tax=Archaeoglobus veneficus (strain DSM 11195 / SNP6) TaxID=693661 RepID=F2KPK4_ARCVS|nr:DUF2299 domain-containing protein [Archaeoglobus veneficus]AEA46435.1 Protein of unknown function DUF2299 [Archaeoglobus veneficus SNP6]
MDVKNWLVEEGIFKKEVPDEVAEWHYVVEFPPDSKQVTDIIKPKGKDFVLVISGLVFAENHYRALHSLPPEKKRNLIHKWKMDLLFRKAEFRMVPDAENVQRIDFSIPIYLEELTKPKLFEALREIFKCKLYIMWNLHHEFDRKGDVDAMYL